MKIFALELGNCFDRQTDRLTATQRQQSTRQRKVKFKVPGGPVAPVNPVSPIKPTAPNTNK